MKKNIFKMKQFWLANLITILPMFVGLFLYNRLPSEMAIHFNIAFNPDNYGPKELVIFGFPLFFVLMNTIVWFALYSDPKGKNINKPIFNIAVWFIPVLSCFIQLAVFSYSLGSTFNFIKLVPLFIGLVFIIIGNYLPKCRQNYVAGFRTPWTLNNKENWRKTNRLAGYLMVIEGIIMVLCTFFSSIFYLFVFFILLSVIIPYGYSYYLYRKEA